MSLRIIGGSLKGKKLQSYSGRLIRPTGNRQREAIFNILSRRVTGACALDLFAGTGALGIEALSRGAGYTVFIDSHRTALTLLDRNIRSCRLEEKTTILRRDLAELTHCILHRELLREKKCARPGNSGRLHCRFHKFSFWDDSRHDQPPHLSWIDFDKRRRGGVGTV